MHFSHRVGPPDVVCLRIAGSKELKYRVINLSVIIRLGNELKRSENSGGFIPPNKRVGPCGKFSSIFKA